MKVYVVGDRGPEHNTIKGIYATYERALENWNELRGSLLADAKSFLKKE